MNTVNVLTAALLSALTCAAQATPGDDVSREFVREQENVSQQLRQQDHSALRGLLDQQVRQNPLSGADARFIGELQQRQRDAAQDKPASGAVYFISFSIPPSGLSRMLAEAQQYSIPATLRGMVAGDMRTTANAVMALVKEGATSGVQIDPMPYREYDITSVPALVVYCPDGHDVLRGNLHLKQALQKVVEKGICRDEAQRRLNQGGVR